MPQTENDPVGKTRLPVFILFQSCVNEIKEPDWVILDFAVELRGKSRLQRDPPKCGLDRERLDINNGMVYRKMQWEAIIQEGQFESGRQKSVTCERRRDMMGTYIQFDVHISRIHQDVKHIRENRYWLMRFLGCPDMSVSDQLLRSGSPALAYSL